MAITFVIGVSPEKTRKETVLAFEPELRDYLRRVSAGGGVSADDLTGLDPYGDSRFEGERLSHLERGVGELLSMFEAMYQRTILPPEWEPPATVGLETEPEGKPFGRAGVLQFLRSLKKLCREAQKEGVVLLAIGD